MFPFYITKHARFKGSAHNNVSNMNSSNKTPCKESNVLVRLLYVDGIPNSSDGKFSPINKSKLTHQRYM